jgi:Dolichyl-phosphate-mannose-protein mannosyltransferase
VVSDDPGPISRRPWGALAVFLVLLGGAWWTFGRALDVRPLGGDNLYALGWVNRVPAAELLRGDPVIYPEWRPISYATVWLQYRWQGLDRVMPYHALNLLLWTACVWLVYQLALRLTSSRLAAWVAAGLLFSDARAITSVTLIIERQTTLATMCGLIALWMALASWRRLTRRTAITLALLCLASALSKEYGLAFAAAIALYGASERRWDLSAAAAAGVGVYLLARLTFSGGATGLYCEYMGYFFEVRKVCYDGVTTTGLAQMAYNVTATGVGTLLPGLLTGDGQLGLAPMRLAASTGVLALAVFGWMRGPNELRLATLVILCSTLLSFMLYAGRNQLPAACAFALATAAGVAVCDRALQARSRDIVRRIGVAVVIAIIGMQAWRTRVETGQQVDDLLTKDPCIEVARTEQHDPAFIRMVKARYAMSDPDCRAGR